MGTLSSHSKDILFLRPFECRTFEPGGCPYNGGQESEQLLQLEKFLTYIIYYHYFFYPLTW